MRARAWACPCAWARVPGRVPVCACVHQSVSALVYAPVAESASASASTCVSERKCEFECACV
eukprot:6060724-Alexandrium_andersonii.AAC.1